MKIVCLDDEEIVCDGTDVVTKHKIYDVVKLGSSDDNNVYYIKCNDGQVRGLFRTRFTTLNEWRKFKLEKLGI